jgi:GR25 family glycosyltransferase involved in LPS biosynthesis
MSHINTLNDMINNNYNNCIIFEDDFEFISNDFNKKINSIFINNIDYDIISLASNIHKLADCNYPHLKRLILGQTTSAYLINKKFVKIFVDHISVGLNHFVHYTQKNIPADHLFTIDQYQRILQLDYKWYVFYPVLGKQRESFSDIEQKIVNYNC